MTVPIKAGVIGWPIRHSRSPLIHRHWLKTFQIAGSYDSIAVPPEEIEGFLADLAGHGLAGCNVTLPYKQAAFHAARDLDPVASTLGAVNTLWLDDGVLCGANTDVIGFLANLDAGAPGWDAVPSRAVMLGAGGAARAVLYGLVERGFEVCIVNRTLAHAESLARLFPGRASAHDFTDLPGLFKSAAVVVNTTSLGMAGQPPLDLDLGQLPETALVTDIVYAPIETSLLARARTRHLRTVDGLGMLLHQAVPGFARWFGVRPEVTAELRALVVADLEAAP